MHARIRPLFVCLAVAVLGLVSKLNAQGAGSEKPSVGDLKEEQRKIGNAYLGDADFQLKIARERLGVGNNRLAQQSGLWALEQLAYAKRRLERHAPKIEEAQGIFGRATESTRKDLRDSYAKIRQNYVDIEERLDIIAQTLQKAGMPILAETLNNVRNSSGEGAVEAVQQGLRRANVQGKGDVNATNGSGGGGAGVGAGGGESGAGATAALSGGGTVMQTGANVSFNFPDGTSASAQNCTLSADGKTLNSPDVGAIDVSSIHKNASGKVVGKTVDGRDVYLGDDGKWHFGTPGGGGAAGSGRIPSSINNGPSEVIINGKRVKVGPKWENGEQKGVATEYGDEEGGILLGETQVTRKLVEASGSEWKAVETPGQSRSWDFNLKKGDEKNAAGAISFPLGVNASSGGGFQIDSWDIRNERGDRAAVNPPSGNDVTATFTKEGRYRIVAHGRTDWGTPFSVKGETTVNP